MAKGGDAEDPDFAQPRATGEGWRPVETRITPIAPRRSAVRARLAPLNSSLRATWRDGAVGGADLCPSGQAQLLEQRSKGVFATCSGRPLVVRRSRARARRRARSSILRMTPL